MLLDIVPERVERKPFEGYKRNSLNQQVAQYGPLVEVWLGVDQTENDESVPGSSSERAQSDYTLYADPALGAHAQDRWVVRGKECFVVGRPEPVRNMFTGDVYHVEVNVRRVEG